VLSVESRTKKSPGRCLGRHRLVVGAVAGFFLEDPILQVAELFLAGLCAALLGTAPRKPEVRRSVLQALLRSCHLISACLGARRWRTPRERLCVC